MLIPKTLMNWLLTAVLGLGLTPSSFGLNYFIFSSHPKSTFIDEDNTTKEFQTEPESWSIANSTSSITANPLEDHKFIGWYTKDGGWGAVDPTVETATTRITESTTLSYSQIESAGKWVIMSFAYNVVVAKYIPLYSVTAKADPSAAGTVSIVPTSADGKYALGDSITLTASPSEDYEFSHWEENGKCVGTSTPLVQTVTKAANYVAVFVEKIVSVSLTVNPNGGIYDGHSFPSECRDALVYNKTTNNQIQVATRDGYRLAGYYKSNEKVYDEKGRYVGGSSCWTEDGKYCLKEPLSVEARWEAEASTVVLKSDDGTDKSTTISATYNESLPEVTPPTRDGYAFQGYFTERGGKGVQYYKADGTGNRTWDLVGDRTLYASWTAADYTLTVLDGPNGKTVCTKNYQTATTNQNMTVALPQQKPGYEITGWTAGGDFGGGRPTVNGNVVTVPAGTYGNIVLTPTWTKLASFVAFDGNGATADAMPVQEFLQGVPQALHSNTFVRAGYVFEGWTNLLTNVRYKDGEVVQDIAELGTTNTLRALWTANQYRVRFFGNGGTNTMSELSFVYDEPQDLTSNAFVRAGYDFVGWATDPTNGVAFADGESVSNLTAVADGVVSLFAKWSAAPAPGLTNPLSIAADCATNGPDRVAVELTGTAGTCSPENGTDAGGNGQYVKLEPKSLSSPAKLSLQLKGRGTLHYSYKINIGEYIEGDPENSYFRISTASDHVDVKTNVSDWAEERYVKSTESEETVSWSFTILYSNQDFACVDNIRWMPEEKELGSTVGVTLRLNDGTPAPADIFTNLTRTVGAAIGPLPVLAGTPDMTFVGWKHGGTEVDENWIVPSAPDGVTLLAQWENSLPDPDPGPGRYGIVFLPGYSQATGSTPPMVCAPGEVCKLSANGFKLEVGGSPAVFKGWRCRENGRFYDDGILVFNLMPTERTTAHLEAVWEFQK